MNVGDRVLIGGGAAALLLVMLAGWLLLGEPQETDGALAPRGPTESAAPLAPQASASTGPVELVVDVEGGVLRPGIQRLPAGSRVADALLAAGGYSPDADLSAAARDLNLAEPLSDGQQIYVPMLGDATAGGGADGGSAGIAGSGGGGLVDLNTATPEQLDALPGIGPVTVQKIIAARQERPFSSLEDAVERGVLNRGQLEEIREQATAG